MSVRRLAAEQPEDFAFTPENLDWAKEQLKKYPQGREASAVLPLMWRAQEQCGGWLPEPALRYIADMLDMAYIRVYEIATFYTMFNLAPVGRYYVQLCGTTPCWLRGAEALKDTCRKLIGEPGHVTKDGMFSWIEVECLGACVNAPMVQINKDYYEDLTPESFEKILTALREGRKVKPGPQDGRHSSEPFGGATTLIAQGLYAEAPARDADEAELALVDDEAKKPGAAASEREAAVPKPPLRDSSGRRRK
jgi:NADH-quinone oxidoreductase subunit E